MTTSTSIPQSNAVLASFSERGWWPSGLTCRDDLWFHADAAITLSDPVAHSMIGWSMLSAMPPEDRVRAVARADLMDALVAYWSSHP